MWGCFDFFTLFDHHFTSLLVFFIGSILCFWGRKKLLSIFNLIEKHLKNISEVKFSSFEVKLTPDMGNNSKEMIAFLEKFEYRPAAREEEKKIAEMLKQFSENKKFEKLLQYCSRLYILNWYLWLLHRISAEALDLFLCICSRKSINLGLDENQNNIDELLRLNMISLSISNKFNITDFGKKCLKISSKLKDSYLVFAWEEDDFSKNFGKINLFCESIDVNEEERAKKAILIEHHKYDITQKIISLTKQLAIYSLLIKCMWIENELTLRLKNPSSALFLLHLINFQQNGNKKDLSEKYSQNHSITFEQVIDFLLSINLIRVLEIFEKDNEFYEISTLGREYLVFRINSGQSCAF